MPIAQSPAAPPARSPVASSPSAAAAVEARRDTRGAGAGSASASASALASASASASDAGRRLGRALVELLDEPDAFVRELREGYGRLADPTHAAELQRVAPGVGACLGVRTPVQTAVLRALGGRVRQATAAECLWLAERLRREPQHEVRSLALPLLRRSLEDDPERSWQLLRQLGRAAGCWVDVDELARVYALGILLETYRWAELEQLVYSPSAWERRLVGSTIASLPFEVVPRDRPRLAAGSPALELVSTLVGDADPAVQKSLAWALRSWCRVDPEDVERLLADETERSIAERDGNRAWVVRATLGAIPAGTAAALRARLHGLRRGPRDTSRAHAAARAFADLIATAPPAEEQFA